MTEKLKLCPFCQSDAVDVYGDGVLDWVHCNNCDAEGPIKNSYCEAIAAWNSRND